MSLNGRLHVSITQLVGWGVLLASILGSWYNNVAEQKLTRQALQIHIESERTERDLIWKAIENVQAAQRNQSPAGTVRR